MRSTALLAAVLGATVLAATADAKTVVVTADRLELRS